MRILIIGDCYLPSTKSAALLLRDLALTLHEDGHFVAVLAAGERLASDRQAPDQSPFMLVRVPTGRAKGASKVQRAVNEFRLPLLLWRGARRLRSQPAFDLIIYYSPSIFLGPLVRRFKRLWRCPAYLVLRDIFPHWALAAGVLSPGIVYRFFCWWERFNYNVADFIGVESPANLNYFAHDRWDKPYRVELLRNWVRIRPMPASSSRFRTELGLDRKVVLFYGGNIGVAQDFDNVLRLAASMRDCPDAHFLVLGEGTDFHRVAEACQARALPNMTVRSAVDSETYFAMLQEFDVGLVTLDRRLTTHNFPGKVLGYLSCGKPVLGSINPGNDLKTIIENGNAGLISVNGDDEGFRENALRLVRDPILREKMGKSARRLLETSFSAEAACKTILKHFENRSG